MNTNDIADFVEKHRRRLRRKAKALRHGLLRRIAGTFDGPELVTALRRLGVAAGDTVMVHSGFEPAHGFAGTPQNLIAAFREAVGATGTLAMMTMPYRGMPSYEWLRKCRPFNVKRSVSMAGIVTEVFRRQKGVRRSVHPTHPVAAWGAKAEWLLGGGYDPDPFGPESPFARLAEARGKVLLYDVSFLRMTFEHYLERVVRDSLPVPLYREPMNATVIDQDGRKREVAVLTLSAEVNRVRQSRVLERELRRRGVLRSACLAAIRLTLGDARGMVEVVEGMARRGGGFHGRRFP